MNLLGKVAPEFKIPPMTPDNVPDEAQDLMQQYGKLRQAHIDGKVSDGTFQTEGGNLLTQMSKYQRDLMAQSNNILGTPNLQPGQVNGQSATFNPSTGQVANGQGQPMPGTQGQFVGSGQVATMQNQNQQNATANFTELTKDHQEILPTAMNALNMVSSPLPANADQTTKAEYALNDKQAVIKYAQALVPASKRPPGMSIEDAAKSGLAGEEVKTLYNKVTGQDPMTETDRTALVEGLAKTVMNSEGNLSAIEGASASRAIKNGVNPAQAFQNVRPPTVPSTSPIFQQPQVAPAQAQTGQIMKNPSDGKYYVFRGQTGTQDYKNKANWMPIQ